MICEAMDFNPINDDHAVESVSFTVLTTRLIDADDIHALAENHNAIRSELPAFSLPEPGTPTVEFAYRRPDGTASWLLRCGNGNEITVECRRYTRWEKVWATAERFLKHAMECCVQAEEVSFINSTLRVTDRFKSASSETKLESIFRRDSLIADIVFDIGPVFHSNVGWFESAEEERILNTLNVQGRLDGEFNRTSSVIDRSLYVVLEHFQQIRPVKPFTLEEAFSEESPVIARSMSLLHARNKEMLRRIVVDKMQDRIGLRRET